MTIVSTLWYVIETECALPTCNAVYSARICRIKNIIKKQDMFYMFEGTFVIHSHKINSMILQTLDIQADYFNVYGSRSEKTAHNVVRRVSSQISLCGPLSVSLKSLLPKFLSGKCRLWLVCAGVRG